MAYVRELESRADVQLGSLLARRRVKAAAVVTEWSKSKGAHAGELSRAEFRAAVIQLGLSSTSSTSTASIDDVFSKYDEDGGGYMDADEAKAMVSGLLKLAEDCEHERVHKQRRAVKMRREANKKAALSQVPVPAISANSEPCPTTEEEAAPEPKKKRPPIRPQVQPEMASATTLSFDSVKAGLVAMLSTERGRSQAEKQRAFKMTMQKAAARLSNLSLGAAWSTWLSYTNETHFIREALERASHVLMSPMVLKAFSKWAEWHDERLGSLKAMRVTLRHMSMAAEIRCFSIWAKSAELKRLLRVAVDRDDRRTMQKLVSSFRAWRQLQLEALVDRNLHKNQLCQALGYWAHAKLIALCSCVDVTRGAGGLSRLSRGKQI